MKMPRRSLSVLLATLLSVFSVGPALALDYVVNSLNDTDDGACDPAPAPPNCTLREAINAANNSPGVDDAISFTTGLGTITVDDLNEGELPTIIAAGNLEIDGGGLITVNGGGLVRVFHIGTGAGVTIKGLTITDGAAPSFENGGGILNEGNLFVIDSTVSNNSGDNGGGIYNTGTLNVTNNSTIDGNTADFGGGGGIYNTGILNVTNSTIDGNNLGPDGGGIYNDGTLTVTNSTIDGNTADFGNGGGIYNTGTLTVETNSTVSNNVGFDGGGIYNDGGGTLNVTDSTIDGNTADAGGGIYNFLGAVNVVGSTLSNNQATTLAGGGGIFNEDNLTVTNSTFDGNQANATSGIGGGIHNAAVTATIVNSTFNNNSADFDGSGISIEGGTVDIFNTIIANSVGLDVNDCYLVGLPGTVTVKNSLVETQLDCGITDGVDGNLTADPVLDNIATGGSPAHYPLTAASPAIDAGDNSLIPTGTATDQANNARVQNLIVDMGAVESGSVGCPASRVIANDRWTQVSVPCDDGILTVGSVFGDNIPGGYATTWIMYQFDTATQQYQKLADTTALLEIGRAYWLKQITGNAVTVDASGSPAPPLFNYPLFGSGNATGAWTMVGNYRATPASICWEDVIVDDLGTKYTLAEASDSVQCSGPGGTACIENVAHRWNGASYDQLPADPLSPPSSTLSVMDGIWQRAYKAGLKLEIPSTGPCAVTRTRLAPDEWHQRLQVRAGDMVDRTNYLGQLRDSADGVDRRDIGDLQPFGSPYLTLFFLRPGTNEPLNSDFRGIGTGEKTWEFVVKSNIPRTVTVSWEDPYAKLADTTLVDMASGAEISPRPGGDYPLTMTDTEHRFAWRVTLPVDGPGNTIFSENFD